MLHNRFILCFFSFILLACHSRTLILPHLLPCKYFLFLLLIITPGIFTVTFLFVCIPQVRNSNTMSCIHTGLGVCVCVCVFAATHKIFLSFLTFLCLVLSILNKVKCAPAVCCLIKNSFFASLGHQDVKGSKFILGHLTTDFYYKFLSLILCF